MGLFSSRRDGALDGLRGVAALGVLASHALASLYLPRGPANPGQFGVIAFFCISGALIPVALQRYGSLRQFWIGRVTRLYPLFWLSIVLAVLLIPAQPAHVVGLDISLPMPPRMLMWNATMLFGFVNSNQVLGVYWTLHVELIWYLLVSVLWAVGLLRYTVALTAVAAALALLAPDVRPAGLFAYLACMGYGATLAEYRVGRIRPRAVVWLSVGVMSAVVLATWFQYRGYEAELAPTFAGGRAVGLALAALTLTGRADRLLMPLSPLGTISYGIYLLHPIAIAIVPPLGSAWWTLVVWTGLTLAAATAAHVLVERPGIAIGRRLIRVRRAETESPVPGVVPPA